MHFFLQMAVILVLCGLLWPAFRRLGQVRVVAIMAVGFLLGPSALGAVWPAAQEWLFPTMIRIGGEQVPHPSLTVIYVVGQLGLVLYMFLVGISFDTGTFVSHVRAAGVTAAAGIVVPMLLGCLTGYVLVAQGGYFTDKVDPWQAGLFTAAAIAITSFPMLAWIVQDAGLYRSRLGTMALSCAAADDACAWILLATVVAGADDSMGGAVLALVGAIGFVLFMFTLGKRLLGLLDGWAERETRGGRGDELPVGPLVAILLTVLLCAWFTDFVGIYSVFGAFIAGVVMPRGWLLDLVRARIEPLVAYLLLPAFFVFAGLNTELSLVFEPSVLLAAVAVLVVSFVGKFGAIAVAARAHGMSWREAGSMGTLANARGLMELILLNIGLTQGLITPALYTILAVMAFVTTFATTPILRLFQRSARKNGMTFGADGEMPIPAMESMPSGQRGTAAVGS